jgi:hypothetical protein
MAVYRLLILMLLIPFRIVHRVSGILALPRLKLMLNASIVLATGFNIHFTLLTQ